MTSTEIRMGPWRPLYEYLAQRPDEADIDITYADIETIVHHTLPTTARSRPEWWTVIPLKQRARSWLAAGRHPFASDAGVVFRRTARLAGHSLEQQRRSRSMMDDYATSALLVPPVPEAVVRGWWEPHIVYVIHFREAGVIKVGLTHGDSNRATVLSGPNGTVLQVNRLANRWSATVLEGAFLRLANDFRAEPPLWLAQTAGVTEFWADSFAAPSADEALAAAGDAAKISNWTLTVPRSHRRDECADARGADARPSDESEGRA